MERRLGILRSQTKLLIMKVSKMAKTNYRSRLQKLYDQKIAKDLQKKLGMNNPMSTPKMLKIVVSMSDKAAVTDPKVLDKAAEELFLITGQKPVVTKAKKAIATFKIRQGMPLGLKVTLRKSMMYDFVDRLVNIALPRVKDFRGLSPHKFDGKGNYAFGIKEHIIFPEINYDKVDKIKGMNIAIITNAKNSHDAIELLRAFNFPINAE